MESPVPGPPRPTRLPNGAPVWLVTRYDDLHQVLTDSRFQRSPVHAPDAPPVSDSPSLLDSRDSIGRQDGDTHLCLRRAVGRAFTPRAVEHMRPWVAAVIDRLLDDLVEQVPPTDLVSYYALPVPYSVIHRLLAVDDVPAEWVLHRDEHSFAGATVAPAQGGHARHDLTDFATALISKPRSAPDDDLVSYVVQAADRDQAAFPANPHDDLFAPSAKPSLAFGVGQHYCLRCAGVRSARGSASRDRRFTTRPTHAAPQHAGTATGTGSGVRGGVR
ncbi:hypothetical protein ACFXJ6_26600 [Streptomyces sp. NPDC059218]|uniref:hypothetical protein n=1 Tax=Streptomyces sp. NPDC059218 TaxID=3346773 RepID=UPI0036892B2C